MESYPISDVWLWYSTRGPAGGEPHKLPRLAVCYSDEEIVNLATRMGIRLFTRLTNAFSKKIENHLHHLDLYYAYYNFIRPHKTLGMTPAMAAGLADSRYDMEWVIDLIDARAMKPVRPKDYVPHRTNSD